MSLSPSAYQVGGVSIPTLLGREGQLKLILSRLTENHICVVGPKNFGKTVLLNGLAKHAVENDHFTACVYWDLRHHIPTSDAEFYGAFAKQLVKQLKSKDGELAKFLGGGGDATFESIRYVFEDQHDKKERLLLILDGLDDTLQAGALSKNVWDNLRSLADIPTLRFTTGSRQPLRALCACPESQTSDFWNIFYPEPVRIGALSEADWDKFTVPLASAGITLGKPALARLKQWTGNCPLLAAAMCATGIGSGFNGESGAQTIDEWAGNVETTYRDFIEDLWEDCSASLQGDIIEICANPPYERSKVGEAAIEELQLRGYVAQNREGLRCSNRFIENCSKRYSNVLPDIKRLFAKRESFERNIKALLELRLQHINGADKELVDHISRAVQEIDQPHVSVGQVRNISHRALKLIWDTELKNRDIPIEWTRAWQHDGLRDAPVGRLPEDGRQLQVLNLLTDGRKSVRPKVATRSIYCLLTFLQSVGNFGQHQGSPPDAGFASSVCFAAIQLAEELSRVLPRNTQATSQR
jgi:hypothetical protein